MTTVPGLIRSRTRRDGVPRETAKKAGRSWRLPFTPDTRRILAFCLLLVALPFLTVPGNLIARHQVRPGNRPGPLPRPGAAPVGSHSSSGQLQDQAAGYLFPMGPFFALGHLAGLEPWVVQRLWIGTVSAAAFAGVVLLCGRLGIGSPWSRIAAGPGTRPHPPRSP